MKGSLAPWPVVWAAVIVVCGWQWVDGRTHRPPASEGPPTLEVGVADAGSEIRLRTGQMLSIGLPPSSGLGPQCWLVDPADAVLEVEQEPSRAVRSHDWTFRAMRIGQGRLVFECHDSLSREPPERPEYAITVD